MSDRIIRVLLVEDNKGDAELIRSVLSRARASFDVQPCSSIAEALEALEREKRDVVMADLSLPDSRGLETVRKLRATRPNLPIVVLTGLSSEETALQSLYEGAQDYLVKDDITVEILERAIRYSMQRQRNVEMRRLLHKVRNSERQLAGKNRRLRILCDTAHRFVDDVSHEFRTPLTVIQEYSAILQEGLAGDLTDRQVKMLGVIADRANDLNTMVDDMLDNSRMRAGLLGIRRRTCRVEDIIDHVRPSLENKAGIRRVGLEFDLPRDMPVVYCDEEKAGRVVVNLTINAIKFAGEPGDVRLWVRSRPRRHDVEIGITDNGPGIPPDRVQEIFERFNQIEGTPRSSTKGFGLGLSIARDLVELNFGEMRVKSDVGCGSTFSFTLPVFDPSEIVRRYVARTRKHCRRRAAISALSLSIDEHAEPNLVRETDEFLHELLRQNDLLLMVGEGRWLALVPACHAEAERFLARIDEEREAANRNRPTDPVPAISATLIQTGEVRGDGNGFVDTVTGFIRQNEESQVAHEATV